MSRKLFLLWGLGLAMAVAAGAWAHDTHPARPGTINYVEGKASIGTEELGPNSPGSVELEKDQTLTTEAGKVEVLLTPGVFLRVADNSSVRMVSPSLANTAIAILKGRAVVEVLDIRNENDIRISLDDTSTKLLSKGLYDFDAAQDQIRVFKGKADVYVGDQRITLTRERELGVNASGKLKAQDFDTRKYEDEFFRWSALRSGYLSEASVDETRVYVGMGPGWYGPSWYGPGWYWNPNFFVYTFLPMNGVFYSPFGWGFYSPIIVYRSPFFYWGYGSGPHRFGDFHYPYGHGFEPRGGFHGGGFHGPAAPARGRR
jgi:hypothetical protein